MNTMSMSSVRRLLNKSISSKQQSKPSPINSKSPSFPDENDAPLDPNIQLTGPQFTLSNPIKSPSKPSISHNDLDIPRSDATEEVSATSDPPVKVVVRIRPKTVNEKLGDPTLEKVSENSVAVGDQKFYFDSVLDSRSKQEDVFHLVGVPLVKDALAGYNSSILSYGQTGSGKTYTMWGPPSAMVEGQLASSHQGIVPRIFRMLFSEIEREKENCDDKLVNYQCRCSFLEIHNGQIGDMLDPTLRNLQIKDDVKNGFYIENLTEEYVTSYGDVTQILIKGLSSRKVGATSISSKSSRSHIVFNCVIESWCKDSPANSFSSSKTSRISIVDLAGMERYKQVDAGKEIERERKDVKNSLSQLGHLVNILAGGTQPDDHMYRDSCLTHLLQQSLGGNAKLSVICTISSDLKNYGETLSTLRFGHRIRSIQSTPVINEITEEDMDGLTDQIHQLKEELIRAKLNVSPAGSGIGHFTGRSVRESVNQLRISLNRSLMLPHIIDNNTEEDVNADENDTTELCKQLEKLNRSCHGDPRDLSCDSEGMNFASVRGSCDSYFTSEHEVNCLHEPEEVTSTDQALHNASYHHSAAYEEPALSESPKIKNTQRNIVSESSNFSADMAGKSTSQSQPMRSSLQSSKIFSRPTESLAASLKRGLEIIDHHKQNSSVNKSSVAFSFEHLTLKPSLAADKANASVQTLSVGWPSLDGSSSSFICASCRQKGQNVQNEVEDSLKTCLTADKEAIQANDREKELEKVSSEQAAKIEELNCLVEQLKYEKDRGIVSLNNNQVIDDKSYNDARNPEPEIIKEACEIEETHNKLGSQSFDTNEKEELLMEIQFLRNKLQAYTYASPNNKSIDKLRSSLLSKSMQIHKSMNSHQFNNNAEEQEKERQRWTEMESEWINLTDELRLDIKWHRDQAEKVEMELRQERKHTEELEDALNRAVLGHARFVEHYVELEEKHNHLSVSHRRVMETITDVKKAAAKAGEKGNGACYAKAFAAELTETRVEEKRERERLRKENKSLRIQVRETAEAVQTAGELLVRLREAEEAASVAESNLTEVQQENDKLRKQVEKVKNKHKMEMVTMKQYMAESKLPESALRPLQFEEHIAAPASAFVDVDEAVYQHHDDEAWRAEFGTVYEHHY